MLCDNKEFLPSCVVERLEKGASLNKGMYDKSTPAVIANIPLIAISSIVLKSSIQQSCKGIISAGNLSSILRISESTPYSKLFKQLPSHACSAGG